jgi:hypothetical protein
MTNKIYRGWIHGQQEDADVLRELGVKLGPWEDQLQAWTPCDVSPAVLNLLDRMWGRFIWGFTVVEVGA